MESLFAVITLSLLLLFANNVNGRKDLGEYWRGVMNNQPMPEAIQGLIRSSDTVSSAVSDSKTDFHTNEDLESNKKILFVKDFEPGNNATSYHGDEKLKEEDKSLEKDIEPRPNFWAYGDDKGVKEGKSYGKDIELKPNVLANDNDVSVKEGKSFEKEIEPRPNLSAYGDDESLKQEKSFVKNMEPRPNIIVSNA